MNQLAAVVALAAASLAPVAFSSPEPQPTVNPAALDANGQPARLLSAFFGLNNGLGIGANRICPDASGKDGMPVVLSHTVDRTPYSPRTSGFLLDPGLNARPSA